jgi:hypothetical protein
MDIRLSKSQLDKFCSCPRCFWLHHRQKLDQPDMISSKVWKGVERIAQAHYQEHREARTTPPALIGKVPEGAIPVQFDEEQMKALRYWGKGLPFKVDGITVTTALDDMLQWQFNDNPEYKYPYTGDKTRYAVIDYKSKSKLTDEAATLDLYRNQADVFDLACNENGYHTDGVVYFDYWSPMQVEGAEAPGSYENGTTLQLWASQVIAVRADHERIKTLIRAAAACIEGPLPDPNIRVVIGKRGGRKVEGCPVCAYVLDYEKTIEAMKEVA